MRSDNGCLSLLFSAAAVAVVSLLVISAVWIIHRLQSEAETNPAQ